MKKEQKQKCYGNYTKTVLQEGHAMIVLLLDLPAVYYSSTLHEALLLDKINMKDIISALVYMLYLTLTLKLKKGIIKYSC